MKQIRPQLCLQKKKNCLLLSLIDHLNELLAISTLYFDTEAFDLQRIRNIAGEF